MSDKRDRQEAVRHLKAEWVATFLDPYRSNPMNRSKRAAILEKMRKWRTDK